jgi:hypothetical protein
MPLCRVGFTDRKYSPVNVLSGNWNNFISNPCQNFVSSFIAFFLRGIRRGFVFLQIALRLLQVIKDYLGLTVDQARNP